MGVGLRGSSITFCSRRVHKLKFRFKSQGGSLGSPFISIVVTFVRFKDIKLRLVFRESAVMEKGGCGQAAPILKKGKKKQAKDELDRLKQAEKKKRRLEKALATSAAIRSELEKKKQKKIEEQQRLDKEGAAIAESVALHVLLGEDTDESCSFMLNNDERYNPWDRSSSIGVFMGCQSFGTYSAGGLGWATDADESACKWNDCVVGQALPPRVHVRNHQAPYFEETSQRDISVGLVAAQAVSSLQIAEDPHEDQLTGQGAATVVFNRMFGGHTLGNKVNLYKKF